MRSDSAWNSDWTSGGRRTGNTKGRFVTYTVTGIPGDASFLEMLDVLNTDLVRKNEEPVAFDHDCREGICGSCGLVINGRAHGRSRAVATCGAPDATFRG